MKCRMIEMKWNMKSEVDSVTIMVIILLIKFENPNVKNSNEAKYQYLIKKNEEVCLDEHEVPKTLLNIQTL